MRPGFTANNDNNNNNNNNEFLFHQKIKLHILCYNNTEDKNYNKNIYIYIYIYIHTRFQKGFHIVRYIDRYILSFSCTCARVHFSLVIVQLVKNSVQR